jgi:hypothetical protein
MPRGMGSDVRATMRVMTLRGPFGYVLPAFATANLGDGTFVHAESACQSRSRLGATTNSNNDRSGQLRAATTLPYRRPSALNAIRDVVGVRAYLKMRWIDAARIVTSVAQDDTSRERPVDQLPSDAMRAVLTATERAEDTIARRVHRSEPRPAFGV